ISLATEADRTLYFDFLPINIGTINGFQAKFQLYTVPGQVYYNATRKLVLRGVDGVVFVADSQPDKMDENVESLANLVDNLLEYGYDINELPMVLQYNKRDLPNVLTVEEMNNRINNRDLPYYEASATKGTGVFDTLKLIIKLVLEKAKSTAVTNKPSSGMTANPSPSQPEPAAVDGLVLGQSHYSETKFGQSGRVAQQSSQGIATQSAPPRTEQDQDRFSSFRPYPGSSGSEVIKTVGSTGTANRPQPMPAPSAPAQTINRKINNTDSAPAQSAGITPTMAPSLKRRGGIKKRGLFKRLFGIK
ncbi:MAG: GTP-binding protein, partial [Candidatus Zixiibacteriota bacterium]